jgi:hypothetical protein
MVLHHINGLLCCFLPCSWCNFCFNSNSLQTSVALPCSFFLIGAMVRAFD